MVPDGVARINATEAASDIPDSAESEVDVAVVDTGIDADHPDLVNNLEWGVDTTNGTVREGIQAADDVKYHGTHLAGIVAAENNSKGVVGVAPNVDLYSVQVLNKSRQTNKLQTDADWINTGIRMAARGPDDTLNTDDDPEIILMGINSSKDLPKLEDAIEYAANHALLVAPVGNSGGGSSSPKEVMYPARYSEVMGVAATDRDDERWSKSAEGPAVEIAAPGVNIRSTVPNEHMFGNAIYRTGSGTSMASPHVAGTAALIMASDLADGNRDLSDADVRDQLTDTALDLGDQGRDDKYGSGRVRAYYSITGRPYIDNIAEPNDDKDDADAVEPGENVQGLKIRDEDTDFYELEDDSGGELSTTISLASAKTSLQQSDSTRSKSATDPALDAELIGPSGTITTVDSIRDSETITYTADEDGSYYLKLTTNSESAVTYDLSVDETSDDGSEEQDASDQFEDNDARGNASDIAAGSYENLEVKDQDWYKLQVSSATNIEVEISFDASETSLSLDLEDSDGWPVGREEPVIDGEKVVHETPSGGTYYINVDNVGTDVSTYNLSIDIGGSGDRHADNRYDATAVSPGDQVSGTIDDDVDYFSVTARSGATLKPELSITGGDGELDMTLLNESGGTVESATTDGNSDSLTYEVPESGEYYVQVYSPFGGTADYDLKMKYDAAEDEDGTSSGDRFEPNDRRRNATEISSGADFDGLTLYDGNDNTEFEDYYAFNAKKGVEYTVTASFDDVSGDPRLIVDGPSLYKGFQGTTSPKDIEFTAAFDQTHYIWVYNASTKYDLSLEKMSSGDSLEINDRPEDATPVEPGDNYQGLAIEDKNGVEDVDYFAIDVNHSETITSEIDFDTGDSDLELDLFGPDKSKIKHGRLTSGGEGIRHKARRSGTYYLRVQAQGATGSYDFRVGLRNPVPPGTEPFEPNDKISNSREIVPGETYQQLNLSDDDEDYFAVELRAGEEITVRRETWGEGALGARLLDPSGKSVEWDENRGGTAKFSHEAGMSGTYYIKIDGIARDPPLPYELHTEVSSPSDRLEPNDEEDQARLVSQGYWEDVSVGTYAYDYYLVDVRPGETLTASVDAPDGEDDVAASLTLNGPGGTNKRTRFNTISYTADEGGLYRIGVDKDYTLADVPERYNLDIDIRGSDSNGDGSADADSGNQATEVPLTGDKIEGRSIGAQATHTYVIPLRAGRNLSTEVVPRNGELKEVSLVDPDGFTVLSTSEERIDRQIQVGKTGRYKIKVDGPPSGETQYDIALNPTGAAFKNDGRGEPNDKRSTATALVSSSRSYERLELHPDEADYYELHAFEGETISVSISQSQSNTDMDAQLLDSSGTTLKRWDSPRELRSIRYEADQTGSYYLRLENGSPDGSNGATVGYSMEYMVDVPSVIQRAPDGFESNDRRASASAVQPGSDYEGLTLPGRDVDYYAVQADAGDTIAPQTNTRYEQQNLTVKLVDDNGTVVATKSGSSDDHISHQVQRSGTYYINVSSSVFTSIPYEFDVAITEHEGRFEPDDNRDSATELTAGDSYERLNVTAADNPDYFEITLDQGEQVTTRIDGETGLDVDLIAPDGSVVHTALSGRDRLRHTADQSGAYYIRMATDLEELVGYNVSVDVTEPDEFEDNDARSTATQLQAGEEVTSTTLRPDDEDYFAVEADSSEVITSSADLDQRAGDVDMELLAPNGTVLTRADSAATDEHVEHEAQQSGTYYVRVFTASDRWHHYNLSADVVEPVDRFESNDGTATATPMQPDDEYNHLSVGGDDEDYFAIELRAAATFEASITTAQRGTDLDPELIAPNGAVVASASSAGQQEQLTHETVSAGTYYVRVSAADGPGANYDIETRTSPGRDRLEPNDNPGNATRVPADARRRNLTLTEGDTDRFAVTASDSTILSLNVSFDNYASEGQILLYGPNGTEMAQTTTYGGTEQIRALTNRSGTHRIAVVNSDRYMSTEYDLQVNVSEPVSDPLEPNDRRRNATDVAVTDSYAGLVLGRMEQDYFVFNVSEGDLIDPRISFDHDMADVNATLTSSNGTVVETSESDTDVETIDYEVSRSGSYYLRVASGDGNGALYDFQYGNTTGDRLEPDDRGSRATTVSFGDSYENLTVGWADDDYFAFDVEKGDLIDPEITPHQSATDIRAELLTEDGTPVASASPNHEQLSYQAPQNGTYYLQISQLNVDETSSYDLRYGNATGDRLEPNDHRTRATPVSLGDSYENLTVSDWDSDYFAFDVSKGELIDPEIEADDGLRAELTTGDGSSVSSANLDYEQLSYEAEQNTTYYLRLWTYGAGTTTYDLLYGNSTGDRLEPDDWRTRATNVSLGDSYQNLTISDGDPDYFAFNATGGELIDPEIRFDGADYPSAELVRPDGSSVTSVDLNYDQLEYEVEHGGTYYVKLSVENQEPGFYDLQYGNASGDRLEPDDWRTRATNVSIGDSYQNLTISDGDPDYFAFNASDGELIDPEIRFDGADHPSAELVRSDGSSVTSRNLDYRSLSYEVEQGGTYYVKLSVAADDPVAYDLVYGNSTGDRLEPDDWRTRATNVSFGDSYQNLTISDGDPDYFAVTVEENEVIDPSFSFDDDASDPRVELLGPEGPSETSANLDDDQLEYEVDQAGTYYLELSVEDDELVSYDFEYGSSSGDRLEPDDWPSRATNVSVGDSYQNLTVSDGDPDYFAFNATEGELIDPEIRLDGADYPSAELVRSDGSSVTSVDLNYERLEYEVEQNGTYYVKLSVAADDPVAYDLVYGNSTGDRLEPDDWRTRATNVSLGDRYDNLTVSDGDPDYFAVTVDENGVIDPSFSFDRYADNPQAQLLGPDGSSMTSADLDYEQLAYEVNSAGTYYVGLSIDADEPVAYDLVYGNSTGDRLEPDDWPSRATNLSLGDSYANLTISDGDPDSFAVTVDENGVIDPSFSFDGDASDPRVELLGPNGSSVTSTNLDYGELYYEAEQTGTYHLRLRVDNSDQSNYTVQYGDTTGDRLEPDDQTARATPVSLGDSYENLSVSDGDPDYFAFTASAGELLDPRLSFGDDATGARLELIGPTGRAVTTVAPAREQLSYEVRRDGTYYLRVTADTDELASYDLVYGNSTGDRLEPDDRTTRATSVSPGDSYENLTVSDGDPDYFKVNVSKRDLNGWQPSLADTYISGGWSGPQYQFGGYGADSRTARIDPRFSFGDSVDTPRAKLLGQGGAVLTSVDLADEELDYEVATAGTYYIRVTADTDESASYDIVYGNVTGDQLEPDDRETRATVVSPGDSYDNLTIERNDPDYFAFNVSEGELIDPRFTFGDGIDSPSAELVGPGGQTVARADLDHDQLTYDVEQNGTFYLRVETAGSGSYEFVYGNTTGDRLEGDDRRSRATTVSRGDSYDNLTVSDSDPDYFAFNVSEGELVDPRVVPSGESNLEVTLTDADGSHLDAVDPEYRQISHEARESGTYYLSVEADYIGGSYRLVYPNTTEPRGYFGLQRARSSGLGFSAVGLSVGP
ncbi:S8 family serine peptidase [Haloarcula sp. S1CR25-12]|uniref:S8 family serine peptidase n=1 Tax=Haloarcula saliterrae TaxID=2950534 RepID=A0ABU2FFV8_9EURY|nr:S8 family serine peptidase [Haloarcula sp. S1CR25-12]MDS0261146.1 S8 family serine peptidase [Haloarcula sp. S1CR25-12]